jgi:hypothetical protein
MRLTQKPLRRPGALAGARSDVDPTGKAQPSPGRDPANDLYDRGCELLLAAQGLRSAACARGSTPAFAATVGCIDASLEALADAVAAMRREAARQVPRAHASDRSAPGSSAEDAAREFSELADALSGAHDAAGRMRERLGPLLVHLTLP